MKEEMHELATRLGDKMLVEGLTAQEHDWLERHLESCASCREQRQDTEYALGALRSAVPLFDPGLVRATQLRTRARARELGESAARMRALWISCTLSWILGVVSAPLLWSAFRSLGRNWWLPRPVWITGLALVWLAPAAVLAAVVVWRQARGSGLAEQ
jgi:hypothetical protein